jgi:hypothetical protein
MSLVPIQERRYNLAPRLAVNDFVVPIYRYEGYMTQSIMPRGMDERHQKLEQRRMITKAGEVNRLILDRPYQ